MVALTAGSSPSYRPAFDHQLAPDLFDSRVCIARRA